jgi:hypothetical protein
MLLKLNKQLQFNFNIMTNIIISEQNPMFTLVILKIDFNYKKKNFGLRTKQHR